ncbi:MAG: hypothetical protein JWQ39_2167 [Glaciihabitans sp.]|nr:hypothetical protein [Glaciihabitans sp.]
MKNVQRICFTVPAAQFPAERNFSLIDFDLSRRPVRPSEWDALATAVHQSKTPAESYWLETKSPLDWSTSHGLGLLARAILSMANRDTALAEDFLEGCGVVIVGLGPATGEISAVDVLDPTDLENKLNTYLGKDGPRWNPHWITVENIQLLAVEVDAPRRGDPGYTLRTKFDDYRASQVFVRVGSKTEVATQSDTERLARRLTALETKESLDVEVGVTIDEPLSRIYREESDVEAYYAREERDLLASLPVEKKPVVLKDFNEVSGAKAGAMAALTANEAAKAQSIVSAFAKIDLSGIINQRNETRTEDMYRAEVAVYVAEMRQAMSAALFKVAINVVPLPTFWLSNLTERNFKSVAVTIRVDGKAQAQNAATDRDIYIPNSMPKRPRKFGPHTVDPLPFHGLSNMYLQPALPYMPNLNRGRRDIRNGGSFEVDLDTVDLRPGEQKVAIESDLAILIPKDRVDPVLVHWRATASNVDAVAQGEFELRFDGNPIDTFAVGMTPTRDKKRE